VRRCRRLHNRRAPPVHVEADAEALKGKVAQRKEELKQAAIATLAQATASLTEAKDLLAKAPKGKGSKADIEAMQTDLAGVEAMLRKCSR